MTKLIVSLQAIFIIFQLKESMGRDGSLSALHDRLFSKSRSKQILYPIRDGNESVTVDIKLDITHIHIVDEQSGTVTTNGLLNMRWTDPKLQWKPDDFGGINGIKVSQKLLWVPDIIVSNCGTFKEMERSGDALVAVFSDGTLRWIPPVTFNSICPMDRTDNYPNSEHICTLRLMSMIFTDRQLKLRLDPSHNITEALEIFDRSENPKWELVQVLTETSTLHYMCCPLVGVPYVEYKLHLRRRPNHFNYLLTVPAIAIALLTLVAFWTETANTKICIAALSSFVIIHVQFFLHWWMPPGVDSSPLIVRFCVSSFVLNVMTMLMTVAMSRITATSGIIQRNCDKCAFACVCRKVFCLAPQNDRNLVEDHGSGITFLHRLGSCALSIIYICILVSFI